MNRNNLILVIIAIGSIFVLFQLLPGSNPSSQAPSKIEKQNEQKTKPLAERLKKKKEENTKLRLSETEAPQTNTQGEQTSNGIQELLSRSKKIKNRLKNQTDDKELVRRIRQNDFDTSEVNVTETDVEEKWEKLVEEYGSEKYLIQELNKRGKTEKEFKKTIREKMESIEFLRQNSSESSSIKKNGPSRPQTNKPDQVSESRK